MRLVIGLLLRTSQGRRSLGWSILTLFPAVLALLFAFGVQEALDQQFELRYQRDIARSIEQTGLARSSYLRPSSASSKQPLRVTTIFGEDGEDLGWPGLHTVQPAGTVLLSRSLADQSEMVSAFLESERPPLEGFGVVPDELLATPNEPLVLIFSGTDRPLASASQIDPGFDAAGRARPGGLLIRLLAATSALLPGFALARSAAVLVLKRNETTIAKMRLFGVHSAAIAGGCALLVGSAATAAATLAIASVRVVGVMANTVSIGRHRVPTGTLNLPWPWAAAISVAAAALVTGSAYLVCQKISENPVDTVRRNPYGAGRNSGGVAVGQLVLVMLVFWVYTRWASRLADAIALPLVLGLLTFTAIASTRAALHLSYYWSGRVGASHTRPVALALGNRLAVEFRSLLVPVGWGAMMAGVVLGVLPTTIQEPPRADLRLFIQGDPVDISNQHMSAIEGIDSSLILADVPVEVGGQSVGGQAVLCTDITDFFDIRLNKKECDNVALLPDAVCPDCTTVSIDRGQGSSELREVRRYEPPPDLAGTIVIPSDRFLQNASNAKLLLRYDWSVSPDRVQDILQAQMPITFAERPRESHESQTFDTNAVGAGLLLAIAIALILTLLAYVVGALTVAERLRPSLDTMRLFGVRGQVCVAMGVRLVASAMAAVILVPGTIGVAYANQLRSGDAPLMLVPGWPVLLFFALTMAAALLAVASFFGRQVSPPFPSD